MYALGRGELKKAPVESNCLSTVHLHIHAPRRVANYVHLLHTPSYLLATFSIQSNFYKC